MSVWLSLTQISFSYLNAREDHRLFKIWAQVTYEKPAKTERDYIVAGLSRKENKKFWLAEQKFNSLFNRVLNFALWVAYFVYCSQLFFVRFDVDWITYSLVQTFQVTYSSWFIYVFLGSVYSVNVFYIMIIRFLSLKFGYMGKQVQLVNAEPIKSVCDRKLARLIVENNAAHLELIELNNFFKFYAGFNLVGFFFFAILLSFVALETDFRLTIAFFTALIVMYSTTILSTCLFANQLSDEVLVQYIGYCPQFPQLK